MITILKGCATIIRWMYLAYPSNAIVIPLFFLPAFVKIFKLYHHLWYTRKLSEDLISIRLCSFVVNLVVIRKKKSRYDKGSLTKVCQLSAPTGFSGYTARAIHKCHRVVFDVNDFLSNLLNHHHRLTLKRSVDENPHPSFIFWWNYLLFFFVVITISFMFRIYGYLKYEMNEQFE